MSAQVVDSPWGALLGAKANEQATRAKRVTSWKVFMVGLGDVGSLNNNTGV